MTKEEIPFGAKDSKLIEATYFIPEGCHAEIVGDKVVIKKGVELHCSKTDFEELSSMQKAMFEIAKVINKYNSTENPTIEKIREIIVDNAFDRMELRGKLPKKEEPVSEDLEEAAADYEEEKWKTGHPEDTYNSSDIIKAVKYGAKWQKAQFEKNRLKHCNSITNEQAELEQGFIDQHIDKHQRMPTFLDAIEYGMQLQKEQMMAKAIDVEVKVDAGGYPYIPQMELYDYDKDAPLAKKGDRYKVILIKED